MRIDGLALRRLRIVSGYSQARLAKAVGVSQPFISYLERGMARTNSDVAQGLAKVLKAPLEQFAKTDDQVEDEEVDALADQVELAIVAVDFVSWWRALQPRPSPSLALEQVPGFGGPTCGDLVTTFELGSNTYYVAIDGRGSETEGAMRAVMAFTALHGALLRGTRGLVRLDELMEAVGSLWARLGEDAAQAAVWVGRVDGESRVLEYASAHFPAPYLRSGGSTGRLHGARHPWGDWTSGSTPLAPDALLVIATDGIAHHGTKSGASLWESAEIRTLIHRAADVGEVANEIARRARTKVGPDGPEDDQTVLVVRL